MATEPFFDEAELSKLGVKIDDAVARKAKIEMLNNEHEMRVGQEIVKQLSDAQVDEFEKLLDDNATEDVQLAWLKNNYPDFEKIVHKVYEELKDELKHGRI